MASLETLKEKLLHGAPSQVTVRIFAIFIMNFVASTYPRSFLRSLPSFEFPRFLVWLLPAADRAKPSRDVC
jgi:hypothetical protein